MIKKNLSLENGDITISIAIMAVFVVLTIQYFILVAFNLIDTPIASGIQLISKVMVGAIFLYALPVVFKRSKGKIFYIYFISILVFLFNFMLFPENHDYMRGLIFTFFFMCLPAFVYSLSLQELSVFKQIMKKGSYIIFIFGFILGVLVFLGEASVVAYSMPLSYYMLIPAIMFIDELLDRFSFRALILVIVSLLVILLIGSRGAILCIVVFVALKLLKPTSQINFRKIYSNMVFVGISIIIFVSIDHILQGLYNFFLQFGINSRSILLFLQDDLHISGRDSIYISVMNAIRENPIVGIGIGGDRRVSDGDYAHNLFLEIVSNFGVPIGGILIIMLLFLILLSLLTKDKIKYNMFIIWLNIGFVHLMISGSYLIDFKFWIFLGVIINGIILKRRVL